MAETETAEAQPQTEASPEGAVEVQEAHLPEAVGAGAPAAAPTGQIDILLDTAVPIEAHLGQVQIQVKEFLKLGAGSVLELDKAVGEPVDLFLKGVRFATGQLVVVGDRLGVRIKEVLSAGPAPEQPEQPA